MIKHDFSLTFPKSLGLNLGFKHLPRDLTNVNEWKIMFDPYIIENVFHAYPTGISVNPTRARNVILNEGCKMTLVHDVSIMILTF